MSKGDVHRYPINARWRGFVNDEEKQRLATIEERIGRKKATLDELMTEKHRIMRRAIMRNRRAAE